MSFVKIILSCHVWKTCPCGGGGKGRHTSVLMCNTRLYTSMYDKHEWWKSKIGLIAATSSLSSPILKPIWLTNRVSNRWFRGCNLQKFFHVAWQISLMKIWGKKNSTSIFGMQKKYTQNTTNRITLQRPGTLQSLSHLQHLSGLRLHLHSQALYQHLPFGPLWPLPDPKYHRVSWMVAKSKRLLCEFSWWSCTINASSRPAQDSLPSTSRNQTSCVVPNKSYTKVLHFNLLLLLCWFGFCFCCFCRGFFQLRLTGLGKIGLTKPDEVDSWSGLGFVWNKIETPWSSTSADSAITSGPAQWLLD